MHLLPTTLAAVADIAEVRENTRYAVTGVQLHLKEDNTYRVDATDTKFLLRVTGECTGKADDYPMSPALEAAPNGQVKGLIPSQTWRKAFADASKLTKRVTKPILQSVAVKLGTTEATFGMTNLESSPVETTRLADGKFPPVDQFIPKRQRFAFSMDGARLAKLMKAMASVCPGEDEGRIDFYLCGQDEIDRIVLKRANQSTEALGLIVPLVGGEGEKNHPDRIRMGKPAKSEAVAVLEVDGVEYTGVTIAALREQLVIGGAREAEALDTASNYGIANDGLKVEIQKLGYEVAGLTQENQRLREELAQMQVQPQAKKAKPRKQHGFSSIAQVMKCAARHQGTGNHRPVPEAAEPAPVVVPMPAPGTTRAERIAALRAASAA